jgi:hypothetical protein
MIDIFIKSYKNDFKWLYHCLNSIVRNVEGYNNLILLIPEKDKHDFDTRVLPQRTLIYYVEDEGNGYLRQQVYKTQAHKYSSADYILFADSDCIFTRQINLLEYIEGDKPEILYTDWSKVGDAICWKQPTETILGETVIAEFMRRNCLIYRRQTLVNLNKWKTDLENIIMSSERFSEFNLIGAYAYKFERDNYDFINTDEWSYTEPKAVQIWSHCSKEDGVSETHLREYIRTIETILKANNIEI